MRQVVLDTETTGLEAERGHRIIEIGCVELRQSPSHRPELPSLPESRSRDRRRARSRCTASHSRSSPTQPRSPRSSTEFLAFIDGAELVIHNAPFDVGFLDAELRAAARRRASRRRTCAACSTRSRSRASCIPGQRNSLDALCKRYTVDNSHRELHGALARRAHPRRCVSRHDGRAERAGARRRPCARRARRDRRPIAVRARGMAPGRCPRPNADGAAPHEALLDVIHKASGGKAIWRRRAAARRRIRERTEIMNLRRARSAPRGKIAAAIAPKRLYENGRSWN